MLSILRGLNKLIAPGLTRTLANPILTTNKALHTTDLTPAEPDDLFSKVEVEVRGHDRAVLNSYSVFAKTVANELGLKLTTSAPDRFIERWTILKSRFSNRKHMRQYEMRTHFLKFNFQKLTGSTCSTLLEYIERNLPAGVAMHVHQTRLSLLPFEIEVRKKKEASQANTPS